MKGKPTEGKGLTSASTIEGTDVPEGRPVRIVHRSSGRVLYASTGQNWEHGFGAGSPPEPGSVDDDGFWKISYDHKDIASGHALYRIVNKRSNRALYADPAGNWKEKVGAGSPPKNVGKDGEWAILCKDDGGCKLINEESQRALYASMSESGNYFIGAGSPKTKVGDDDGMWEFQVPKAHI